MGDDGTAITIVVLVVTQIMLVVGLCFCYVRHRRLSARQEETINHFSNTHRQAAVPGTAPAAPKTETSPAAAPAGTAPEPIATGPAGVAVVSTTGPAGMYNVPYQATPRSNQGHAADSSEFSQPANAIAVGAAEPVFVSTSQVHIDSAGRRGGGGGGGGLYNHPAIASPQGAYSTASDAPSGNEGTTTETQIVAKRDAPDVPGGLYYAAMTSERGKADGKGGTPYSILHMALDFRAGILDRLDSLLVGTAMSVDDLDLGDEVARGQGGVVRRGTVRATGVAVAVKFSLPEHTNAVAEFREEAAFLVGVRHENVVALLGLSTTPPCIVMEWCGLGSLESWLEGQASTGATVASLTVQLLVGICRDLLTGMAYLESLHCVHRDLAARNVLLTEGKRAKIADFGRSRRLTSDNDYYRQKTNIKSPLRWMSPDAIKGKFSGKSDVWAYGVVCWETFTVGEMPYWTEGCYLEKPDEVMKAIFSKDVLPQPPGCPDNVYSHMKSCWHAQPDGRPTFADLVARMELITPGFSNISTTA